MPVNLSIKNVPERIVRPLRAQAKRNHRSLQGELMAILDQAAASRPRKKSIVEIAAELKAMGVQTASNSVEIVREMRDARSGR
jgi:antitoxin FitA